MDSESGLTDSVNLLNNNNNINKLYDSYSMSGSLKNVETFDCCRRFISSGIKHDATEISESKLQHNREISRSMETDKIALDGEDNTQESSVKFYPQDTYSTSLHPDIDTNDETGDQSLSSSSEAFHGGGEIKNIEYIDNFVKDDLIPGLSGEHEFFKFVVYENVLSEQLNKSISEVIDQDGSDHLEHDDNYLIFSTTHSKLSGMHIDSESKCQHNAENEPVLNWDISPKKNMSFFDFPLRHSTPRKHEACHFLSDVIDSESDEDNDIEESYLETLWISRRASNLHSCSLFVQSFKQHENNHLSQSMICRMEDVDDLPCSSFEDMNVDFPRRTFVNYDEERKHINDESFPLIQPLLVNGPYDTNITSDLKMSYKDKLMKGLALNASVTNVGSKPLRENILPASTTKDASSPEPSAKHLRDQNHNLMTNEVKTSVINHLSNGVSITNSISDPWNEQKSRKNTLKRVHKSSDPTFRVTPNRTSDSSKPNKFSKVQTKAGKVPKVLSTENKHSADNVTCFPKDTQIQSRSCHPPEVSGEKKNCDDRSRSSRKRSKKLKKFCSLDFSEFHENSGDKISKTGLKWKSHDDLDSVPPSSLKSDNCLLWPLVGLAVLAGFVAFCFRDRISFMIASKFPFERPPT